MTKKCFTFFYAERNVKTVFTPNLFVSFRSGYSLRNYLVRTTLYALLGKKVHFVVGRADVKLVPTQNK